MKKPIITEDEWIVAVSQLGVTVVIPKNTLGGVCDVCDNQNTSQNAKAISAVPEMIDALISAQQFIENGIELGYIIMPDEETGDPATETPKKIEQALKKAGCTE